MRRLAALTVTGPRQRVVDFTQPFYSTGLGIAVPSDARITWWPIIRNVFSPGFIRAAAVLFAISLSVGVILWLIEHRYNEHFGAHRRGLGASVWWSASAMTQAGEKVPVTLPGRLLAMMWMVTSVIVFASFTANVAAYFKAPTWEGEWRGGSAIRTCGRHRQHRGYRISSSQTHRLSGSSRRGGGPVGTAKGSDRRIGV
jgi:polar amino acid transport system substrate-binding protein